MNSRATIVRPLAKHNEVHRRGQIRRPGIDLPGHDIVRRDVERSPLVEKVVDTVITMLKLAAWEGWKRDVELAHLHGVIGVDSEQRASVAARSPFEGHVCGLLGREVAVVD